MLNQSGKDRFECDRLGKRAISEFNLNQFK